MGFKNRSKSILAGGIFGLAFIITLGLFLSDVELEYSEPAEVQPAAKVQEVDFEAGADYTPCCCNPEIDKDGDNIPDNLDVEGSVDWSYCSLEGLDLSNRDLSNVNLSNAILTGADLSNAVLTGAILTGANLENAVLTNAILNCVGHPICV